MNKLIKKICITVWITILPINSYFQHIVGTRTSTFPLKSFLQTPSEVSIKASQKFSNFPKIIHPVEPIILTVNADIADNDDSIIESVALSIQNFLDRGSKISQIYIDKKASKPSLSIPFLSNASSGYNQYLQTDNETLFLYCATTLEKSNPFASFTIRGRLCHEIGNYNDAITHYTKALSCNPKSATIFRHLGSAYHGKDNLQLAFASYQQAIELDPSDSISYLKLAFIYEDLSKKDWINATKNAINCYEYYLKTCEYADISALIRYGNFLTREHEDSLAIDVYTRAVLLDSKLSSIWFNLGYAQYKSKNYVDCKVSFRKVLSLDYDNEAAKLILTALDDFQAKLFSSMESQYVIKLFNAYAPDYEQHARKLKYNLPRILRDEVINLLSISGQSAPESTVELNTCNEAEHSIHTCESHTKHDYNISLDILDLGCGTGLAGGWLKDFSLDSNRLVGVDISGTSRLYFVAESFTNSYLEQMR